MAMNYIDTIEGLVEDYGWDAVIEELQKEIATAPMNNRDEIAEFIKAAITVIDGDGQHSAM